MVTWSACTINILQFSHQKSRGFWQQPVLCAAMVEWPKAKNSFALVPLTQLSVSAGVYGANSKRSPRNEEGLLWQAGRQYVNRNVCRSKPQRWQAAVSLQQY
ncbi:hypothetical protein ACLOJK_013797 [Asimina triloba]